MSICCGKISFSKKLVCIDLHDLASYVLKLSFHISMYLGLDNCNFLVLRSDFILEPLSFFCLHIFAFAQSFHHFFEFFPALFQLFFGTLGVPEKKRVLLILEFLSRCANVHNCLGTSRGVLKSRPDY